MNVLAFDCSGEVLSIAIRTADGRILSEIIDDGGAHSERLLPECICLASSLGLELRDFSRVVCSRGPGSFTGLRIGMAAAKGIAMGAEAVTGSGCVISVSTLEAIAAGTPGFPDRAVLPVLDAKKKRWYTALFVNGERVSEDLDASDEVLIALAKTAASKEGSGSKILVAGPSKDAEKVVAILEAAGIPCEKAGDGKSIAETLIGLSDGRPADEISQGPVYIRKSDAEEALEEKLKGEKK